MKVQGKRLQSNVGTRKGFMEDIGLEELLTSLEEEMKSGVGIPGGENLTDEGRSTLRGCPRVEHY